MQRPDTIILCQPDNKKGCSVCCGLYNFKDLSGRNLSKYLIEGKNRILEYPENNEGSDSHESSEVRDITSFICPYQGFVHDKRPGCLIHPSVNKKDLRDVSFFGKKICDSFLCPAHTTLDNEQKKNPDRIH